MISAGTIIVSNTSALSTSGTIPLGNGSTGASNVALLISSSTGALTYSRPVVVSSSGNGAAIIGRTGSNSTQITISSAVALNRDTTFQSSTSGTLALSGTFTGSGNAIFTGGGITALNAISSGSGAGVWTGGVSVTGSSVVATGTGASANLLSSGTRSLSIEAGSGLALAKSGTFKTLAGGGYLGTASGASISITVGGSNSNSTFDGVIGGTTIAGYTLGSSLNLIKTGSGTLALTGNNTYTGTTTISQGKLALSGGGGLANTPAITITSGAVFDVSGLTSGTFALGGSQTLVAGRTSGFANDVVGNIATSGTVNIAGSGTAGTLTVSGNLSLSGGKLLYDFANVTTSGSHVNDLIAIGGNLLLSGTTVIAPTLLNGTLSIGTYTLISGGTTIASGNGSNLAWGGSLSRQSVTFDTTTTPGSIYMTVTGVAANLIWTGTNGSIWDTNTTVNWNNAGTPDVFIAGDNVTLNDTSANGTVNLSGSLQTGSVTVNNNTTAYAIGGSGQIGGPAGLLKSGTGTLTISTTNSYTGGTVISAGTVIITNANALGTSGTTTLGDINTGTNSAAFLVNSSTGATTFSRPVLVSSSGSGAAIIGRTGTASGLVTISSALTLNRDTTFQSSTSGTLSVAGAFNGSGNAIFTGGGVTTIASSGSGSGWTGGISVTGSSVVVSGSSNLVTSGSRSLSIEAGSGVAVSNNGTFKTLAGGGNLGTSGSSNINITAGAANASSTFGGTIGGTTIAGYTLGSSISLIKTGSGTLALTGNNTYTGSTTISQGKLALSGGGTLANTPSITITPGAVFDVSGLSSGTFVLGSNQALTAGRTSGFANDVVGNIATNGKINIAGSGTAGTLTVNGNLGLAGGSLQYDIAKATTVGSHVNDLISIAGTVSLSGTTVVTPTLLDNALTTGTYTLVSGGTGVSGGSGSNLVWGGPVTRQGISFDATTNPGTIYMVVSGSNANLVWSGTSGNVWNTSATTWSNVSSSGTSDKFYGLDDVVFNDTAATGNVILSGSLQAGSVTVNNNTVSYTMSGTGQIVGAATLVKSGSASLTLTGTQAYTGATTVTKGSLVVNGSIVSSGTVTVSAGASLGGHGAVGLIAGSGTVAPGDPTILTASQVDPSGGLDFTFVFGKSGAPVYSNATDSGNDVLHLTDPTPYKFALTSANTITADFTGLTLTQGEIFYGGFFTDAAIDGSMIGSANFVYTGLNGATVQYEGLVTVPSADFASGTVTNGKVMEFSVTAVPEPNAGALLGAGALVLFAWGKRRHAKKRA